MTTTPIVGATDWAAAQASPWAPHNEAIRRIESGYSRAIIADRDLTAPPGSCADGAGYLVGGSATGLWASHDGELAVAVGTNATNGWYFIAVEREGFRLYVQDEDIEVEWDGAAWGTVSTSTNPVESIIIACSDETTGLTTGAAKVTFRMPYPFTLQEVRASVTAAPTDANLIVDINEGGTSILSTKLSIDAGEKTSMTAATPAVISDADLADDAEMTIDIDQIGSTVAGAGLKVVLIGTQP